MREAARPAPTTSAEPRPAVVDIPFERWYRAEHRRIAAVVAALVNDAEVAADVTDEAFARALARWDRVRVMEHPSAWVYRVAVNLAKRRARRVALERRLLLRKPAPLFAPDVDAKAAEVWDAVRGLPPRQRLAVVLRYVDDLPEAEVAAVMGVAPGTVAATLHAARHRLAEMWGGQP